MVGLKEKKVIIIRKKTKEYNWTGWEEGVEKNKEKNKES